MLKKIFIFIWLFLIFLWNTFAFDANLQINKKNFDINDYINLKLEISSLESWAIQVKEIKWLENFEILWQSQSQSSSSQVVIVNWKTKSETKTILNLDLTLKSKTKWDFVIWPAILTDSKKEIETNSINIKISGNSLFLNNNHLKIKKQTKSNFSGNSPNKKEEKKLKQDEKIETFENVEKKDFSNNNIFYLFILISILTWLWFFFLLKNKKNFDKKENNFDFEEKNNFEEKTEKVDFEKKVNEKIIYPKINDKDFVEKINDILRKKIEKKYNIKNIFWKTFEEILSEIRENKDLENLINMINKAKYSNLILDNEKILEKIKEI